MKPLLAIMLALAAGELPMFEQPNATPTLPNGKPSLN